MKHAGLYRWSVLDKHTGRIVGGYTTERGALNAAAKLCEDYKSPKRYVAKVR